MDAPPGGEQAVELSARRRFRSDADAAFTRPVGAQQAGEAKRWELVAVAGSTDHGLVTRDTLETYGIGRRLVRRWTDQGRLHMVGFGVWRIAGVPTTWRQCLRVGVVSLGADACVSHEAAAQLHAFDRTPADRIEFTVPRSRRGSSTVGTVHTTNTLPRSDVVRVDRLPVTSATRTIIDLARARVDRVRLEVAIDSAIRSGASAPLVLARRLSELRGPGRWGCRLLDTLLVDSGGETILERRFLSILRRAGLPRPRVQVPFRRAGRTIARVDFYFEGHGVVVEVSGQLGHASPRDRAVDAQRRNELQDLGVVVYEYTSAQIRNQPDWVAATMNDRLQRAASGDPQENGH